LRGSGLYPGPAPQRRLARDRTNHRVSASVPLARLTAALGDRYRIDREVGAGGRPCPGHGSVPGLLLSWPAPPAWARTRGPP